MVSSGLRPTPPEQATRTSLVCSADGAHCDRQRPARGAAAHQVQARAQASGRRAPAHQDLHAAERAGGRHGGCETVCVRGVEAVRTR